MNHSLITFSQPEKRLVLEMAKMSWDYHKQRMGSGDTHINKAMEWRDKLIGTAGEFAFCKHYNLWPEISEQTALDVFYKDLKIDVKSSTYKHCNLLLPKYLDRSAPPDYYYLVHVDEKSFTCQMVGFCHSRAILNPKAFQTHHPITGRPLPKPGYFMLRESLVKEI